MNVVIRAISALTLLASCAGVRADITDILSRGYKSNIESETEVRRKVAEAKEAQARAAEAAARARLAEQKAADAARRSSEPKPSGAATPPDKTQPSPAMREWLKAAGPRMHLYPDFEEVVFTREVAISTDMVRLMAGSPLAADIAYYLAKRRMESLAISQMSLLDAARAVDRIERTLKEKVPPL